MKILVSTILIFITIGSCMQNARADELNTQLLQINNFHFVSPQLASSGLLELDMYTHIEEYGFKHVINLIPGNQDLEKTKVKSLGLSYEQIEVDWSEPTLEDFERFLSLMEQYKNDKVYVHCELNYRASTFVFLYRIIQNSVDEVEAMKDLNSIWKPSDTWTDFIDKVKFSYQD